MAGFGLGSRGTKSYPKTPHYKNRRGAISNRDNYVVNSFDEFASIIRQILGPMTKAMILERTKYATKVCVEFIINRTPVDKYPDPTDEDGGSAGGFLVSNWDVSNRAFGTGAYNIAGPQGAESVIKANTKRRLFAKINSFSALNLIYIYNNARYAFFVEEHGWRNAIPRYRSLKQPHHMMRRGFEDAINFLRNDSNGFFADINTIVKDPDIGKTGFVIPTAVDSIKGDRQRRYKSKTKPSLPHNTQSNDSNLSDSDGSTT